MENTFPEQPETQLCCLKGKHPQKDISCARKQQRKPNVMKAVESVLPKLIKLLMLHFGNMDRKIAHVCKNTERKSEMRYECPRCCGNEVRESVIGLIRKTDVVVYKDREGKPTTGLIKDKDDFKFAVWKYTCLGCGYVYQSQGMEGVKKEMEVEDGK